MGALSSLKPRFIDLVPRDIESGFLYISIEYATTVHLCACGCGERVVLPLHPTDWKLSYDGLSVTMRPSVGNWGFPCRSHYLITKNLIEWAGECDEEKVAKGRHRSQVNRIAFDQRMATKPHAGSDLEANAATTKKPTTRPRSFSRCVKIWRKLWS